MNDVTYVLGYWPIKENTKHPINHYKHLMPKTLKILGNSKMVFFCNEDYWEDYFNKHAKSRDIKVIRIEIEELPTFELSKCYLKSCNNKNVPKHILQAPKARSIEKGIVHYKRDYIKSGKKSFLKVFSVWTSKIGLVKEVIEKNPFQSNKFAWVDPSVSRMNNKRNNWNFMLNNYSKNYIYHYYSVMNYLGKRINIAAGFMFGHKNIWQKLIPLYEDQIEKQKNSNYVHDEETLLEIIHRENKDLFSNIHNL